jgi:hypothetical protein
VFASPAHVAATVTSVATGAWSNPATWDTGVPGATDDVVIGAGTTVTIDTTPITVNSLTVDGTLQYDATLRALTVTTNVSISPGGTLQTNTAGAQTGHTLTVGGNLTNNGTLDLSTSANTSGARLTFTGAASNTFSGTGLTTDLRTLTINKGTSNANILEITTSTLSVQGTVVDGTPMAFLTITNGTLKISGTFVFAGRTFTAAAFSIPATAGFWLNNPNYTVSGQNGSSTLTGVGATGTGTPGSAALLRISAGTFNIGTSTGNSMGFGNNTTVIVEGGAVNATGRFGVSVATNNLTYTQTGGVITVCTIGNASSTQASFDLGQGVGPDVVLSGGTVIIRINCTGVPARDYRNQQGFTSLGITNTVLQFADAGSGVAKTFNAEGLLPNVVVSNASAGHTVLFRPPSIFNNSARDVTINPGCTYNIGNQIYMESGNTVTNNGTLTANTPSARFIWSQPGGNCTYQGTGVSTGVLTSWETQTANLTMSQAPQLVVRRAIIFTGNMFNSSKLTLGDNSATLNPVQIGNTTTPTAAGALTSPRRSTSARVGSMSPTSDHGVAAPAPRSTRAALNNLWYDDNGASHTLTIAGGDITVSGTTALTNGRVITNANTLVANGVVTRNTGYVDGLLQKPVTVGGPVARMFEVGDALAYSPINVTFASVTGAGALSGKATGGDHAQIGSSDIIPSKSVNRNWTLTNSGTTFTTADAVFNFVPGDIDGGANFNNFFVRKYDAPNWSAPTTGTRTATSTQATGITSFSDFAVGEPPTFTIVASAGTGGSISPSGSVVVKAGSDQAFTISPVDKCHAIADVLVDGVSVGAVASYTFSDIQASHTISASFALLGPFTITASAGAGGTISPNGATSVSCGGSQSYVIAPSDKCHVIGDVLVDGVSVGAVANYTFSDVQANHTISASFTLLGPFTITASAGAGGTISPDGATSVSCGGSQSYVIAPGNKCATITDVLVDGVSVGAVASYTFSDVQANHTISASFTLLGPFTITASAGAGGTISPDGATSVACGGSQSYVIAPGNKCAAIADVLVDGVSVGAVASYTFSDVQANHTISASFTLLGPFTITASAGAGGTISPDGATSVSCGGSQSYVITPSDNCHVIADLLVDGVSVGAVANYTFSDVQANHTITASFSLTSYTIAATAGSGGSITPSGNVSVACGADQEFQIAGDKCHVIADVVVDGVSQGPVSSYTFTNVQSDHTISATFNGIVYTILATAGSGGSISPSGLINVSCDDDQKFTITPDPDAVIADVVVDGVSQGAVSSYTFTAVQANHTINATFDRPVPVLVTQLEADQVGEALALRWELSRTVAVASVSLERAENEVGPWTKVDAEPTMQGSATVATDRSVVGGRTYWYRLVTVSTFGGQATFGPLKATAAFVVKAFSLDMVAPNPTRGALGINFAVVKPTRVHLSLLDVQGREVEVLADGEYGVGRYHAQFDGQGRSGRIPAGVYFVRYIAGKQTFTKRVAFMQ